MSAPTKRPTKRTIREAPGLVSVVTVARYLGVPRRVVHRALAAGLIKGFQTGPHGSGCKWLIRPVAQEGWPRWVDAGGFRSDAPPPPRPARTVIPFPTGARRGRRRSAV